MMTVRELIQQLSELDSDAPILLTSTNLASATEPSVSSKCRLARGDYQEHLGRFE